MVVVCWTAKMRPSKGSTWPGGVFGGGWVGKTVGWGGFGFRGFGISVGWVVWLE